MKSLFWKKADLKYKTSHAPKPEEGQSLTYMIDKNKYILFGGYASKDTGDKDSEPNSGTMHTSGLNTSNSMAIKDKSPTFKITGSTTSPASTGLLFSQNKPKTNDSQNVYIYDPAENSWQIQKCKDKIPSKRIFHHSWYEAPNFFVYGGTSQDKKILFDIYVLNTDSWTWKKFFSLDGPLARLHSAFVNLGVKKYLIGGASYPENLVLNDIWSLSFEHVTWKSQFDLPGIVWEKLELKEGQMPNIKAHAAIRISDNLMFIFGGYDQRGECTNTSLLLDTEKLKVIPFETKGKKPGPRAFHKMIYVKEDVVCLFGGVNSHEDNFKNNTHSLLNDFYILNISEGYWSIPNVGGYIPSARSFFAMASNLNEAYNQIIVLGGKTYDKQEEDVLYILSELSNDDSNAYGPVYDKDKELGRQFLQQATNNVFGIPSSAKKMEITKSAVEINMAEKMIVDQKKHIGELEGIVKDIKDANHVLEQKRNELKKQLTEYKKKCSEEVKTLNDLKDEKSKRNEQNSKLNDRLKLLLAYEKKKRKLAEVKSLALQSSLRKSENFIITIDSFYNKCLKDNLLTDMIKDDVLNRIEAQKTQHKEVLVKFKEEYEIIYEKEKNYRADLKSKKGMLKQQMNLSETYKAIVSKDEEKFLAALKKN